MTLRQGFRKCQVAVTGPRRVDAMMQYQSSCTKLYLLFRVHGVFQLQRNHMLEASPVEWW
jgi:hypothetical protein